MPLTASSLQNPLDGVFADDDAMPGAEVRDDAVVGVRSLAMRGLRFRYLCLN